MQCGTFFELMETSWLKGITNLYTDTQIGIDTVIIFLPFRQALVDGRHGNM